MAIKVYKDMEKRLYIKPEAKLEIAFLDCLLIENSGETDKPMTKEREDDELDIEKEAEKMTPEYSLW